MYPDSDYPGGIDSFPDPDLTLDGTPLHSELHLSHNDALEKIETELGVNPAGAFTTVAARLAVGAGPHLVNLAVATTDATTTGSMVDWVTLGSVTVPAGATKATVAVDINEVFAIGASCNYSLRPQLGGINAAITAPLYFDAASRRRSTSFSVPITPSGSGAQTLLLQARRDVGTGTLRVDSTGRFSAEVWFS